ncbi:hypothetical protein BCR35DRAFT_330201 [Leucosporidium creatinivorum]|uniref:F-box domain-containing protein n=1 Tax=Leucosporidium creatinivorum TaxID=106004 RepID=A0A1Y2FWH5_9BASI|nr:hypothetical protein BCR35DRAFT_330201 [Leucosporidium creatinivorum]
MAQQEEEKTTSITLPPEIWLDILSRCSYFDLKKAQRVCKSFNELIKTPHFDSILFRAQADPSTLTPETRPLLHPVLKQVDILAENEQEMVIPGNLGQNIADTEFVSYPSSSKVELLGVGEGASIDSRDGKGLTLGDLLMMISDLWNEPFDDGLPFKETDEPWDGEGCGLASDDWYESGPEEPSYLEEMLESSPEARFRGWEKPKVKDRDNIILKTRPYTA